MVAGGTQTGKRRHEGIAPVQPDSAEFLRRRRSRNRALLAALLGLVVLLYVLSFVRMTGN